MRDYTIEGAKDSDLNQLCKLLSTAFSKTFVDIYRKRWNWFRTNPLDAKGKIVLTAKKGSKVIGTITQVPTQFFVRGKKFNSVYTADLVVDAEQRGKGIGSALLDDVKDSTEFIFTLGSSKKASPVERKQGYSEPFFVPLKIKMFNADAITKNKIINSVLFPFVKLFFIGFKSNDKTLVTDDFKESDSGGLNELWSSSIKRYKVIGLRSPEFLKWRFIDWKDRGYSFRVAKKDGKVVGYIVYRVTKFNEHLKKGIISDFLVSDDAVLSRLIDDANAFFAKNKATASICYFNLPEKLDKIFRLKGYRDNPFMKLDYRYQVTDKSKKAFIGIKPKDIYITNLDGDTDLNNV